MLKKIVFSFLLVGFISSCLDPYSVDVEESKDLLVVDACITNENRSHQVKLTRSIPNLGEVPKVETNALVTISCNDGTQEILKEYYPGVYKTDSLNFVVKIGKVYTLSIQISNGKKYSSEECEILEPSEIDKIYYERQNVVSSKNESMEGISFFIDGNTSKSQYLRWMYEEDWKFSAAYPNLITFDENKNFIRLPVKNYYCWKKSESNDISIYSLRNQNSTEVKGKKICFIPSDNTDRFNFKYAIQIKQLSISKKEYEFWDKLKNLSENVGDVFGSQPSTLVGNIKSDDDKNEPVLGYFQTGSVASKRIFIDYDDVVDLKLELRNNQPDCIIDTVVVDGENFNSYYDIFEEYVLNGNKKIYSLYDHSVLLVTPKCCDCSLTGTSKKPKFWEN